MSRTYKDRPKRVMGADKRLKNSIEIHDCAEHRKYYRYRVDECDIDTINEHNGWAMHCFRYIHNNNDVIFKEDRQECHRLHRAEERAMLHRLVVEYNNNYEIEDDYVFTPHVKNAYFGGGYFN